MKLLLTIFTMFFFSIQAFGVVSELDSDSAIVSLDVAKFASITGLDDFVLSTSGSDGSSGAIYSGNDSFNLESNCAVSVSVSGGNLSKGLFEISTIYQLDSDVGFDTSAGIHNAAHTVSAQATLGNISSQEAGGYSSEITITVAAL